MLCKFGNGALYVVPATPRLNQTTGIVDILCTSPAVVIGASHVGVAFNGADYTLQAGKVSEYIGYPTNAHNPWAHARTHAHTYIHTYIHVHGWQVPCACDQ